MGPRPRGRGNAVLSADTTANLYVLQWGRARAGAEIGVAIYSMLQGRKTLQWGRARAGAEISAENDVWTVTLKLQWGRARAGAEIARR